MGSVYLLYIAFLVSGGGGIGGTDVSHPLNLRQAIAFRCLNPKAWILAVAAVVTFLPPELHRVAGMAALATTVMPVVIGSSSIWAVGGAALGRIVEDERARRAVGIGLAVLLAASVVLIWI